MALMKYKTEITLYNSYFDMNDKISPKAILNIFQDVASIHAEDIGVGYETMLNKNLYWVLSRIKFDILKQPQINQTVIVETWPHEKGRIDFDRDMKILSQDGEVLVIATSKWCIIDTETRMLKRTDDVEYIGEVYDSVNYEERFGKISVPQAEKTQVYIHEVKFCDLDHNKHMNNTNYANLALNVINNKNIAHFEINFINECRLGDNISVSLISEGGNEIVVGENMDKTAFVALVR